MTRGAHAAPLPSKGYRHDIDGLRALSILLVVAFHAGLVGFEGGYVGVDVFFVISGYLITGLLAKEYDRNGRISITDFYARRIRRLLPMAGLVIVSTFGLGLWLLPSMSRVNLLGDVRAAALYFANWRFAGQATAYSDVEVTESLLLHYWSLSVEEQFYVVWPLLVIGIGWFATRRRRQDLFLPMLGGALGLVVVGSLWASIALTERMGPQAYYVTYTRLWEMGVGAGLALLVPRTWRRLPAWLAEVGAVGGVAAIVASAMAYSAATAFPGWAALVPVTGTAMLIVSAAHQDTFVARMLTRAPMPYLGRISYAWYLWHWPLIGAGLLLHARYEPGVPVWTVTVAAVAVSLALSALSHVVVENPLRHAPWLRVSVRRSLAFGATLTVAPVVAVVTFGQFGNTGDEMIVPPPDTDAVVDDDGVPTLDDGDGLNVLWDGAPPPAGTLAPPPPSKPMTPRQAAGDVVTVIPEGCHVEQGESSANPNCVVGDPDGDTTVVVFGDSHARHWLPTIDVIGQARGWRVVSHTKSACTPIDVTVWNGNFERVYDECSAWRQDVIDMLEAEAPVDVVIVSRAYSTRVIDDDGSVAGTSRAAELWRGGAARTFDALLRVADRVVMLRDTPWSTGDVPTCLSEHSSDPTVCSIDMSEQSGLDESIHEAERAAAPDGVLFADPTALVCAGDPCHWVTPSGMIKYSDRHHMTQTFSRSLADGFLELINEVLGADDARAASQHDTARGDEASAGESADSSGS